MVNKPLHPAHIKLPTVSNVVRVDTVAERPPSVTDAFSYLDAVEAQFRDQPDVYNQFLVLMNNFKSRLIDTRGFIERVSCLFHGHPQLIQGFNAFLPVGYAISAESSGLITVTTPTGTMMQTMTSGGEAQRVTGWKGAGSGVGSDVVALGPGSSTGVAKSQEGIHHVPSPAPASLDPLNFNGGTTNERPATDAATQYVQKVKQRCDAEIYRQFVEVLRQYLQNHGTVDVRKVYMQISRLFKDTPDLCSEFRVLMPDTLKHKRKSEENKESEEGRESELNEISGPSKKTKPNTPASFSHAETRHRQESSPPRRSQQPSHSTKQTNIGFAATQGPPLEPQSAERHTLPTSPAQEYSIMERSGTETGASAEPSIWRAERETLHKKISDLSSELQKYRTVNTSSTGVEVGTSTEDLDDSPSPEITATASTLSNQILGIFASSMLDPRTLKALGIELNNARAEAERMKLKIESDARSAERSQQQYEDQLAAANRATEREINLRNDALRNASNAADEISRLNTANLELQKQNAQLNERMDQLRALFAQLPVPN